MATSSKATSSKAASIKAASIKAASIKESALSKGARSRARVIAAAANLLQRRGYNGTGISEILKASATPKGSLYFHFPGGKEELTIAALKESGTDFGDKLRLLITPETSPGHALQIASGALAQELVSSGFEKGCPLATVTLEAAAASESIRQTCEEQFRGWHELIEAMLVARGLPATDADEFAVTALSSLEGAMLLCRAYRSTEPLEKVGKQLRRMAEHLLASHDVNERRA